MQAQEPPALAHLAIPDWPHAVLRDSHHASRRDTLPRFLHQALHRFGHSQGGILLRSCGQPGTPSFGNTPLDPWSLFLHEDHPARGSVHAKLADS